MDSMDLVVYKLDELAKRLVSHMGEEEKNDRESRQELKETRQELVLIRIEVERLKIKASLWGFAAGSIPPVVLALIEYIKK